MRRAVAVPAVALAIGVAGAGIALAFATASAGDGGGGTSPSRSPSTAPVAETDFCYVEAMIYYRVEETELAASLDEKDGVADAVEDLAAQIAEEDADELVDLRSWYVSWSAAKPIEEAREGPCAGHGADHAQMPGMPSWAQRLALSEAQGDDAERAFVDLVLAQNAGMTALISEVLATDAHPRVRASAERVLARSERDIAALEDARAVSE